MEFYPHFIFLVFFISVCEGCGRNWTSTLAEVPVTSIINDLDEYYKSLSYKEEEVEPPKLLYVFRPSERDVCDTSGSLSIVAPRQDVPYHWHINHYEKSTSQSNCRIIPCTGNYSGCKSKGVCYNDVIKEEIDPLVYHNEDIKPDIGSIIETSNEWHRPSISSKSRPNPATKRPSEESVCQIVATPN